MTEAVRSDAGPLALDGVVTNILCSDLVRDRFGGVLDIRMLPRDAAATEQGADGVPVLNWELTRTRGRIGPFAETGTGCRRCRDYWLDHNRPDRDLWASLPEWSAEADVLAELPWPPVMFEMLEAASLEVLNEADSRLFVDITFQPLRLERHRFQPSPGCETCTVQRADSAALAALHLPPVAKRTPTSFRAGADVLDPARLRAEFVDWRVGLVYHMYRDASSVILPMWAAETKLAGSALIEAGFGRTARADAAEAIAILEGLERFCGQSPHGRTGFRRASWRALLDEGAPAVDPRDFILCPESQHSAPGYNLAPYDPRRDYDWIWAYSFARGGPVLIPLQFGFYDQRHTPRDERFVQESSNGCALGGHLVEAVFHALLELIERDAYMTRWHVQGEPRRIDLGIGVSREVHDLAARAHSDGFEVHAFDITLEVPVPTVLAMIVDPADDAPVKSYCASAAHPVADKAIHSALVEVISSIAVYQKQFGSDRARARELFADSNSATQMRDHILLHSLPESIERLAFLDRIRPAVPAPELYEPLERLWRGPDLTTELFELVDRVRAVASDVIVVNQTAEMIRPAGLHCVKVLAPGTHPVTFGHQYRRVSDARLYRARQLLCNRGERYAEGQNPFPHNFP